MMLNSLLIGLLGPPRLCQTRNAIARFYESAECMRFRLPDVIFAEHRSLLSESNLNEHTQAVRIGNAIGPVSDLCASARNASRVLRERTPRMAGDQLRRGEYRTAESAVLFRTISSNEAGARQKGVWRAH